MGKESVVEVAKNLYGKPELMGYEWLFLFYFHGVGISHRAIKCISMGHGGVPYAAFSGVEFFFDPVFFVFLSFLCNFFCHHFTLTIPKRRFCMYCFFLFFSLPMCYILHWLSCVTTNMEPSHTTILVRGRRWGKSRFPYQAFLCVLPATIVLRDLKRVLVSHPLERPGVSRSPKVCSSGY